MRRVAAFILAALTCFGLLPAQASALDAGVQEQEGIFRIVLRSSRREEEASTGKLGISLLYGDQEDHPDGMGFYTHSTMSGFIKLEPSNLTQDLENIKVRLTVPKEYVEAGSINIPAFTTNSSVTKYTIPPVIEDEDNYYADIDFEAYDKTQTLLLPFALSFKDDVVPENYELPVTAGVVYSDGTVDESGPVVYKPLYKQWGIDKYVNTNRISAFKNDGVEAVVASRDEGGNPYLDDRQYVDFCFEVNLVHGNNSQDDYRDVTAVTLTDMLPRYKRQDGSDGVAVFDPGANPGWTLDDGGKTVSKTYTGKNTGDVLLRIYDDTLRLRFPGLAFEQDPKDKNNLAAGLTNEVRLEAVPGGEAEGEARPEASDKLDFVISTDPSTAGSFQKLAMKGNIYDSKEYKANPYPWRVRLSNNGARPLEHIVIQDRKIEKGEGEAGLGGLDPALKFVKLESDMADSAFVDGAGDKTFADMVDHVTAYYADGSTEDFPVGEDGSGNFSVEFDGGKTCCGYDIAFKDGFSLLTEEAVSFTAYTVYRDPEGTAVPEGAGKVRYGNSARSVNRYLEGGEWVWKYITCTHDYDMLPVSEELKIGKRVYGNSLTENNMAGDVYKYWISFSGFLEEGKDYGNIYVVDLLPNEVDFRDVTNGRGLFEGGIWAPEIRENYRNSGRTALIWTLSQEALMEHLKTPGRNNLYYVPFQFSVRIREDAHAGTIRNDIYLVGDNLAEYSGNTGGTADIYDLDNDGRTDDMVAYACCDAVITAAASVYAEKSIAPAGTDGWNKQGLSLDIGSAFDYRLKVVNELNDDSGLTVYDVLPEIGDKDVFGKDGRGSEFQVRLREAIVPPEGYTAWYTESLDVYGKPMGETVSDGDIWSDASAVSDWSAVTAFKLVADAGTVLAKDVPFEVCVPARISGLSGSADLLAGKDYMDSASGTAGYLEAVNSFGFLTDNGPEPKESNPVWVRLPFAGFKVRKVDGADGHGLEGAEFTLSKDGDESFEMLAATSGADGLLEFHGLEAGEYLLIETEAPAGYVPCGEPIHVTITRDPVTMEYAVEISGIEGSGTGADPFLVENTASGFELPKTGGSGIALYVVFGSAMALLSGLVLLHRKKRG